jgi:CheY-like chemotaxis protein
MVKQFQKMLVRLIGEDIRLETYLGSQDSRIFADQGQMEQVLMNLVVNARDAMPEGGTLTIETADVELDEEYAGTHGVELPPGSYVMLAVSDTGVGMDEETQRQVFEPFFTTKEVGKGTGLGLSTVYGIVKQNKGYIWVYSEPGRGSTFKIYLPRAEEEVVQVEEQEKASASPRGEAETVLVVEDDEAVLRLVKASLERMGYRVLAASDPQGALALMKLHSGPIRLLLTDVVLPGINGKTLAEMILVSHPETKVLYTSGYTQNAIAQYGVLEPGVEFIEKPFTPEALVQKVREVLDKPK